MAMPLRGSGTLMLAGLLWAGAAHAQLGSVNNPPPQNLFHFEDAPQLRDDGLGTMAERRARLAHLRRRPVARPHRTP